MFNVRVFLLNFVLFLFELYSGESTDIVLSKSDKATLRCISTDTTNETALIWMGKNGENLRETNRVKVNYIHQISKKAKNMFIQEGTIKNSLDQFAGVVLDRRWDDFPIINIKGNNIRQLANISNENFAFAFSIRIEKDGYLYLCDSYYPWKANNCYYIVLGGWQNKKSGLRKCIKGELFEKQYHYPVGDCHKLLAEFNGPVVSKLKWNHFIIQKKNNEILLYHYGYKKPLLAFTDFKPFRPTYMTIRSFQEGYLKLHDYNYYNINTTRIESTAFPVNSNLRCIKIYVKPCSECTIEFILQNQLNNATITSTKITKNNEWQVATLRNEKFPFGTLLNLVVKKSGSGSYFIGDIIDCQSQEHHEILTNFQDSICCNSIKYDMQICSDIFNTTTNIKSNEADYMCPENSFGKSCIPCGNICKADEIYCEVTPTNDILCNCHNGYHGTNCDKRCDNGYYGRACRKQCGFGCHVCHHVEGCKKLDFPILINKPKIKSVDYDSAIIEIDLKYAGIQKPTAYVIEVRNKLRNEWEKKKLVHGFPNKTKDSQRIDNLSPKTQYFLRVILSSNGGDESRSEYVQTQEFTTKCKDIKKGDVIFRASGSIVTVHMSGVDKFCSLEDFMVSNGTHEGPLRNGLYFSLRHCENYIITISKNGTKWNDYNIRTGEDEVIACIVQHVTNTTATINWDPHKGVSNYSVSYKYLGSLYNNCTVPQTTNEHQTVNVRDSKVHITDLKPYSNYSVSIRKENHNISRRIFINTASIEKIDTTELGKPIYTQNNYILNITTTVNCDAVKGPVSTSITLECLSTWCLNDSSEYKPYNGNNPQFSFRIKGFSDYKAEIRASRGKEEIVTNEYFTTNATAPGPVMDLVAYSNTNESLSIRWKPPYPSMGNLSHYLVEYAYKNNNKSSLTLTKDEADCKLWRRHYCVKISKLHPNKWYNVSVSAVNAPHLVGVAHSITGLTIQKVPSPPSFLEFTWDQDYERLTVIFPHPYITNGSLIGFQMFIDEKFFKRISIKEENATYSDTIESFPFATKIKIEVAAFNEVGLSGNITNSTYTPPPIPQFNTENIRISPNITNITIILHDISPPPKDVSRLIAIIVTNTSTKLQLSLDNYSVEDRKIIQESKVPNYYSSWVFWKENDFSNIENLTLCIGGENSSTPGVLCPNTEYNITIFIKNTFQGKSKYLIWSQMTETLSNGNDNLYLLLLLILLIIPICIFLLRSKGITINTLNCCGTKDDSKENNNLLLKSTQSVQLKNDFKVYQNIELNMGNSKFSNPVNIGELENYIKVCLASGEFERQHELFPIDQTKTSFGDKIENKHKNYNKNISAYDHSRVRLDVINGDPNSEYINANYIDGYDCKKAFIATQGPKAKTTHDFWRMVWQEKVEYIVVLANMIEDGKRKFVKYWPHINETLSFGDISVRFMSNTTFINFEQRIFTVTSQGEERLITQLHFLSWSNHAVPTYPESLGPFLERIMALPQGSAPIVVHCSAGVGRTGSLILADICLRMAEKEGCVNVFYHLHKLRQQRRLMVDNAMQYKLVHLLLLHCLLAPETSITCTEDMHIRIRELIASEKIIKQMEYLEKSAWQDEVMHISTTKVPSLVVDEKNRFKNIVPDEHSRIFLTAYPPTDEKSTYINAVKLYDFQQFNKFVITQYPLKNTVRDFWRLVLEQEITIVICLNELYLDDEVSDIFYPLKPYLTLTPAPYLNITLISLDEGEMFDTYTLNVIHLEKIREPSKITLIQLKGWNCDQVYPTNPTSLVTLLGEMNRIVKHTERILISCYDGVQACGLFAALYFVVQKIKLERKCDVCLAVKTVRRSRKEFVRKVEQLQFLYLCALHYYESCEMYCYARLQ